MSPLTSRIITDYYAAINELAAMLADGAISRADWHCQREHLYHLYHEVRA